MPQGVVSPLEITIFQTAYEYARAKNKLHVEKWFQSLSDFMECFYKSRKNALTGYEQDLDLAYRGLQYALQNDHCRPCVDQDDAYWEFLCALFEVSTSVTVRLTNDSGNICENIVCQVGKLSVRKL